MPRSNEPNLNPNEPNLNPQADPLAPLEHLLRWPAGAALHIVLGALLGLLAAHLMRRRHLHWSWAAGALALVLLTRAALAGSAATLGVAALVATVRGRRWHGEDLQAGLDLAEIAASRTSPADVLRLGAHGARRWLASSRIAAATAELCERWSERLLTRCGTHLDQLSTSHSSTSSTASRPVRGERKGGNRWFDGEELTVGGDRRGRSVSIELGGESGGAHTLVVGATGSGKTVTQTWIATRAIAHGMAAIVIDPKDDRALREQVRHAALAAGRRFIAWTPEGPSVYNPYARGGETEIADKALASERFTEPHYQRQAQRYLGHAVRALRAAGREVSLAGLVEVLDPARLELLVRDLEPERSRAMHAYLDSLTARQQSDLTGVRDRLAIMSESDVGRWLDPAAGDAESFDLLEAVRAGAVVCLSLQADSRPLLSQMLGGRDRAGPADGGLRAAERSGAVPGGDRRVLGRGRGARREALWAGPLSGDEPAAGHTGALRSASAGSRDAVGAGARQPHEPDRPSPGGPRLG